MHFRTEDGCLVVVLNGLFEANRTHRRCQFAPTGDRLSNPLSNRKASSMANPDGDGLSEDDVSDIGEGHGDDGTR